MSQNEISSFAHIIGDVKFGSNNFVSPGALIIGPISIGDNNFFGPNCVIGAPPQDDVLTFSEHISFIKGERDSEKLTMIGSGNVFREFSTVHQGLTTTTTIRDNCYVMSYAHIAHDCFIDSGVKLANSVQMGGYTTILRGSYVGLGAILHQFITVGAFSMIGMGSVLSRNSIPAGLTLGTPARTIRLNRVALQKYGVLDFDWEVAYIKDPGLDTIHVSLQLDFDRFLTETKSKLIQREEVSAFRDSLKLTTKIYEN